MRKTMVAVCALAGLVLAISNFGPLGALAQDDTQARPGGSSAQAGGQGGTWFSRPVQDDTRARPGGNSMNAGRGTSGYFVQPRQDDTQARPGGSSAQSGAVRSFQPSQAGRYVQQAPAAQSQPMSNQQGQVKTGDIAVQRSAGAPFLGVDLDSRARGAVVKRVHPATAAAQAGLMPGDTIRSLNGHPIHSPRELTFWVSQMEPGKQATIQFDRSNTAYVTVTKTGETAAPDEGSDFDN